MHGNKEEILEIIKDKLFEALANVLEKMDKKEHTHGHRDKKDECDDDKKPEGEKEEDDDLVVNISESKDD